MEGKYLTKDQRVKLAHQIRKSHFTLGGGGNFYNTTSNNFFVPPSGQSIPTANLGKELRKTHLMMGNNASAAVSEFNRCYTPKVLIGNSPDYVKKDLKKHNMILGTTGITYSATTSANYKGLSVDVQNQKSLKQVEKNLRKHHFELGTDKNTKNTNKKYTQTFSYIIKIDCILPCILHSV